MREDYGEWELVGWTPKGKEPDHLGEFIGKVGKVLPNGSGFVECQECKDAHQQDAYIHSSVMQQCNLDSGMEICFNVHVNSSGRPQVSAPCWKRRAAAPRGFTQRAYPREQAKGSGKGESRWNGDSSWSQSSPAGHSKAQSWGKGKGGAGWESGDSWGRDSRDSRDSWSSAGSSAQGKGKGPAQTGKSWEPASSSKGGKGGNGQQGDFLIGHIKHADAAKGCSFISCPDTGFDSDTYVHHMTAPPQAFALDDVVAFKLHVSGKGRPQADTVYKMVGFTKKTPQFGQRFGILRSLLNTGNGFIECNEIKDEFGKDAFIHQSVVDQCGLTEGDNIAFDVHISSSGSPQVSAPCWVLVSGGQDAGAPPQQPSSVFSQKGSAPQQSWSAPSQQKGYSKSDSHRSSDSGKSSVWVSKGGTMRIDSDAKGGKDGKGKGPPAAAQWAPRETYGKSKGKGWAQDEQDKPRSDAWGAKASKVQLDDIVTEWMPDEFYGGRVLLLDPAKGVSLVKCPDSGFDKDIYVHSSVANPGALGVNDAVCFKMHVNKRGMPQASAPFWKRVGDDPAEALRFGDFEGLISASEDGSLTVSTPEISEAYGQDAFLPEDVAAQCSVVEGNLIRFNVHVNGEGGPEVIAPIWICCSDESYIVQALPGQKRDRPDEFDELGNEPQDFQEFPAEVAEEPPEKKAKLA